MSRRVHTHCAICAEPLLEDDFDGHYEMNEHQTAHLACMIRSVAGSVAHQQRRCSCCGGTDVAPAETGTYRESAIAAWKYYVEHTL